MNPQMLMALLTSFGPAALSKLFGNDPQAKLRKQIMQLLSPQNAAKLTNQFYQQGISSPAFSQGQQAIAAGANQASNSLAGNLGARGIGTTGTGAVLSSLTPSLVGSQQAGLRSGFYNQAQEQAQNSIQQQIAALTGTSGPSETQKYLAGGLDAFSPFLQSWLKQRFGGTQGYTPGTLPQTGYGQ